MNMKLGSSAMHRVEVWVAYAVGGTEQGCDEDWI